MSQNCLIDIPSALISVAFVEGSPFGGDYDDALLKEAHSANDIQKNASNSTRGRCRTSRDRG